METSKLRELKKLLEEFNEAFGKGLIGITATIELVEAELQETEELRNESIRADYE